MTITLRSNLNRPLTWSELDNNFSQVDGLVTEAAAAVQTATSQAQSASGFANQAQQSAAEASGAVARTLGNPRELWRRQLADANITLVSGSFEEGGTLTSASDALWYQAGAQAYTWTGTFPKTVTSNSIPDTTSGSQWVSVTDKTFRNVLNTNVGAGLIKTVLGLSIQDELLQLKTKSINILDYLPADIKASIHSVSASQAKGSILTYINQAISDAASTGAIGNGGEIFFPAGFYWTNTTINIPKYVSIRGNYPNSYIMATSNFSGTSVVPGSIGAAIVACDNTGQDVYRIEGFQINAPTAASNLVGLHIGGCRNSIFQNISVTGCYDAAIMIYPKNASSGDVENFTLRNCWALGGGVVLRNNPSITRGNITDGQIENCMLFAGLAGQSYTKSNPALRFTSRTGKQIYGIRVQRCYTMTINQSHVYLDNVGGFMLNNTLTDMAGETQLSDGTVTQLSDPIIQIIGSRNSTYENLYRTGVGAGGITISNSHDNIFSGFYFPELLHVGIDNKWLYLDSTCYNNTFENIHWDYPFDIDQFSAPFSVMKYFTKKINDDSQRTIWRDSTVSSNVSVAYGRTFLLSNNGSNIPQATGISMTTQGDGSLGVSFPADAATYTFQVPINNTLTGAREIFVLLKHVFTSYPSGGTPKVEFGIDGKFTTISPQSGSTYYAAISRKRASGTTANVQIRVSSTSTRSSATIINIQDLVISGDAMAYPFNYSKNQALY